MRESKPHWSHMQGQAAVHAVCTQVLLRGHVPCFPDVDYGYDIVLDSGIRIQVKSARMRHGHPGYPDGCYRIEVREGCALNAKTGASKRLIRRDQRKWEGLADFFIFWLVEENRFLVIPCDKYPMKSIFIRSRGNAKTEVSLEKLQSMVKMGMTKREMSIELGVHWNTINRKLRDPEQFGRQHIVTQIMQYEDRWDLLDVNKAAKALVESATEVKV